MRVYIGWDPRDELAFRACVASLRAHSSIPLEIYPLKDYELRRKGIYGRPYYVEPNGQMIDERDGRPFSTQFSFTRFAVPLIAPPDEWVLFCDADMLWRADIATLLANIEGNEEKAILCVKHDYWPKEATKMDGMLQAPYLRKNWSSLMLMHPARSRMTPRLLNEADGRFLHILTWQPDETIGALPNGWNWLEGWAEPISDPIGPAVVHYTRGTPDMLGDDLPFAEEWRAAVEMWRPEMNHHTLG